ncbi:hypothetical protein ACFQJD_17200 [Haloplanus sp. GCM10025708]|uniref:DUF7856 family protein n=1 Tax=Haloplanus sp. GCM10025708 TaxID=3252679 RepID=UPI0036067D4D
MNAVVAGRTYEGRAIDVDAGVSAAAVARAVRGEDVDGVSVSCPSPTPVHDYVGLIPPSTRSTFEVRWRRLRGPSVTRHHSERLSRTSGRS